VPDKKDFKLGTSASNPHPTKAKVKFPNFREAFCFKFQIPYFPRTEISEMPGEEGVGEGC